MTTDRDLLVAALRGFELMSAGINAVMAEIRGELSIADAQPPITWRRKIPALLDTIPDLTTQWIQAHERKPLGKRKMSAAARKAIGDAQRKRWKAYHKARKAA